MLRLILDMFGTRTIRLDGDVISSDNGLMAALLSVPVLALAILLLARRTRTHGMTCFIYATALAAFGPVLAAGAALASGGAHLVVATSIAVIYGAIGGLLAWLWTRGDPVRWQRRSAAWLVLLMAGVLTAGAGSATTQLLQLESGLTGEGTSVIHILSVCHSAQAVYHRQHGRYASVNDLHRATQTVPPLPGSPGSEHYGYRVIDMKSKGGAEFNRAKQFGLCAVPREYMVTGQYTVITDQSGTIYYRDNGGAEVRNFPAHAEANGWTRHYD